MARPKGPEETKPLHTRLTTSQYAAFTEYLTRQQKEIRHTGVKLTEAAVLRGMVLRCLDLEQIPHSTQQVIDFSNTASASPSEATPAARLEEPSPKASPSETSSGAPVAAAPAPLPVVAPLVEESASLVGAPASEAAPVEKPARPKAAPSKAAKRGEKKGRGAAKPARAVSKVAKRSKPKASPSPAAAPIAAAAPVAEGHADKRGTKETSAAQPAEAPAKRHGAKAAKSAAKAQR